MGGRAWMLLLATAAAACAAAAPFPRAAFAAPASSAKGTPLTVPAPSPTQTPKLRVVRGGPVTFSLSGSLQMGEQLEQSDRTDPVTGLAQTTSYATSGNAAGMLARIERRTASTTLFAALPAGVSSRMTNLGELQAGYYSPLYALLYGGQTLAMLGGVPAGQTLRGPALELPLKGGGDLMLFDGPGYGVGYDELHVEGLRVRSLWHNAMLEFGADRIRDDAGHRATDLIAGFASRRGLLDQSFETALQSSARSGGIGVDGASTQYRLDYGGAHSYASLTARHVPGDFLSVGNGALVRDDLLSASLRGGGGRTTFAINEGFERTGDGAALQLQRNGTLTLAHAFRSGGSLQLTLSDQRQSIADDAQWTGTVGVQAALPLHDASAFLGVQAGRTTSGASGTLALIAYSGELQRYLGRANLSAGYQFSRQIGGGATSLSGLENVALTVPIQERTSLTFSTALTRSISAVTDAVQITPLVTLTRRFSPAVSLALTYGTQTLRDRMNPSANGRSRIFQLRIAAPFALGNGLVVGRVDPNLPATIAGNVLEDQANQAGLGIAMPAGLGNVDVVLDNDQVRRTDLSGRFQFNFVKPGVHTVRLESASLPRGVTADQPYATIAVQGGQTGQVTFRIGTYGAIVGHLYGRNPDGSTFPVTGAVVTVDKTLVATTDAFGAYGVGRLSAGRHVVAVDPTTIPANVSFAGDEKQTVNVANGAVTTANFQAASLGSVAGYVRFDATMTPAHGGVNNAYVIAQPGSHAAITNPDGSFLLDNLPPGDYALSIDPETLPDDTVVAGPPVHVTVAPGQHVEQIQFAVSHQTKAIVFSFHSANVAPPAQLQLETPSLPPQGATAVVLRLDGHAERASFDAFGAAHPLSYDAKRRAWVGRLIVPAAAKNGMYRVTARAARAHGTSSASAELSVDDGVPIATFVENPPHPAIGQYVTVHARFLADVAPGDEIRWLGGEVTRLGRPLTGRVYAFTVKISRHPMTGVLLTREGDVPITLR